MSSQHKGLLFVLGAATAYALLPIAMKNLYQVSTLSPIDVAVWRYVLATPLIWLIVVLRPVSHEARSDHLPRKQLLLLGLLYSIGVLTAFFGLQRLSASTFTVLSYTYPAIVALLSVVLGQRMPLVGWVALGMTAIGLVLSVPDVSTLNGADALGLLFAMINAFSVAVYYLVSARVLRGHAALARGTAWVVTGTLLTFTALIPLNGLQIPANMETWGNLLFLALVCTALPIFALNSGIQLIGAPKAAIASSVQPVQTMLLALLLLGEVIEPLRWVGALLIVAAVVLLQLQRNRGTRVTGLTVTTPAAIELSEPLIAPVPISASAAQDAERIA